MGEGMRGAQWQQMPENEDQGAFSVLSLVYDVACVRAECTTSETGLQLDAIFFLYKIFHARALRPRRTCILGHTCRTRARASCIIADFAGLDISIRVILQLRVDREIGCARNHVVGVLVGDDLADNRIAHGRSRAGERT